MVFGNELVNIDTKQILQDTPQVQHGEVDHGNILDCRERDPLVLTASIKKTKLSFYLESARLVSCLIFLLFSYVCMVVVTFNTYLCKDDRMINFINNLMVVFVFVMMRQMILS